MCIIGNDLKTHFKALNVPKNLYCQGRKVNAQNTAYKEVRQLKKKDFSIYFDIFSLEKIPQIWEGDQR